MADVKLEQELRIREDFPVPTYEEWKAVVEQDLKGVPFEKKLLTKTYEGITLQPIYTRKDIENLPHVENTPGYHYYVRSTKLSGYLTRPWDIAQEIPYSLPEEFNEALTNDLKKGQTAINIFLDKATQNGVDADKASECEVGVCGLSLSTISDIEKALNGVDLTKYPIYINAGVSLLAVLSLLAAYAKKHNYNLKEIRGSVEIDPISSLLYDGKLNASLDNLYDEIAAAIKWAEENAPNLRIVSASGLVYHNAGATAVQELAYTLSAAINHLDALLDRGIDINTAAKYFRFSFGIGTNYFMEIAKLRAARYLWAKIVESYGGDENAQKMLIHGRSSIFYQTVYDPYVNMLRTTTEAFSAVIGGVDSLHSSCFNESIGLPDEFARRIARNVQILLNEESNLSKIIDPAGGSYYIEKLTDEVANLTLKMVQDIDDKGGIVKFIESGELQSSINAILEERKKDLAKRKTVLVGTNQYANTKEEKLEAVLPDCKEIKKKRSEYIQKFRTSGDNSKHTAILQKLQSIVDNNTDKLNTAIEAILEGATLGEVASAIRSNYSESQSVTPLKIVRLAEDFEQLRNAVEDYKKKTGSAPKLYLANMGPLKQHKARADFSRGFFEVGGFDVIYPAGADTPEQAAEEAVKSGAKVVVICSTDETYPELVPPFTKKVKEFDPNVIVVLAGYPKEQVEAHKQSGVDEFIFLGADVYAIISNLFKKLGVL